MPWSGRNPEPRSIKKHPLRSQRGVKPILKIDRGSDVSSHNSSTWVAFPHHARVSFATRAAIYIIACPTNLSDVMTVPAETIARSSAAERMRLHRERRRNGMRSLWVELRVTEIDALVRTGLLKVETRNDPNAIREALYGYLDQTLGRVA